MDITVCYLLVEEKFTLFLVSYALVIPILFEHLRNIKHYTFVSPDVKTIF